MSSRPHAATVLPIASRLSSPRLTSAVRARAWPPAFSICCVVPRAASASRSTTVTRAPSRAKRSAVAWPMPDPAPVTRATLAASFMDVLPADAPLLPARVVDLAEEHPALAVELGELLLLDRVEVGRARVDLDTREE